jgi:hypothetical protein
LSLGEVTLCVPFYRNSHMLESQLHKWQQYPSKLQIIVVDDGSPEPAKPIIQANASAELLSRIRLYRIMVDVPWNREEARNLAAKQAETSWLIQIDIDHVLPWADAHELLNFQPDPKHWYRFPRWRVGKADETRKKDALRPDVEFGKIHPHVDSYLIRKETYMDVGGYDLAFSGCLGGGSDFLKRLEAVEEPKLLPDNISLHVYTRSEVKDASDWSLSRDTNEGKRRARAKQASRREYEKCAVRSPWERQL